MSFPTPEKFSTTLLDPIQELYNMQEKPTVLSDNPPVWVLGNDKLAVRIERTDAPKVLLEHETRRKELLDDLYYHDAQVMRILGSQILSIDGLDHVLTSSPLLDTSQPVPFSLYGSAIASLHNASRFIDLSKLPLFNEHKIIQATVLHMIEKYVEQGRDIRVRDILMPPDHLRFMHDRLNGAAKDFDTMISLTKQKKRDLVAVQADVHKGNVAFEKKKSNTSKKTVALLDLPGSTGPVELDRVRINYQWLYRFPSPESFEERRLFLGAYDYDAAVQPDPEIQAVADSYGNTLFSFWLGRLAFLRFEAGESSDLSEWLLGEAIHRIECIDDPKQVWHPYDENRKKAAL